MKKLNVFIVFFLSIQFGFCQFEQFENVEESTTSGFWTTYLKDFFKMSNFIDLSSPYAVSGGFNAETRFYNASGIDPQQSPVYWFLSGNVNARIYEFDIPMSFLLSLIHI